MVFELKELIVQHGNIFKNIVKDVLRECNVQNCKPSIEIVQYVVLLLMQHPEHNITVADDRNALQSFVNYCVSKIVDNESTLFKTFELQLNVLKTNFDVNSYTRRSYLSEALLNKVDTLFNEIVDFEPQNKEDYDILFKKILFDIIISNKLGNPSNYIIVKEVTNALKSVMTRKDLMEFTTMKRKRRIDTLTEMRKIVCGIMIFNQDAGECGHDMRNIINDVSMAFKNTKSAINEALKSATKSVESCYEFLQTAYSIDFTTDTISFCIEDEKVMDEFRQLNILLVQYEFYLKKLFLIITIIRKELDEYFSKFRSILRTLHESVQYRVAVPTEMVFPQFSALADLWQNLWNYLYFMVEINRLNESLCKIKSFKNYDKIMSDLKEHSTTLLVKFQDDYSKIVPTDEFEWISSFPETEAKRCPMLQFCAYIFSISNGIFVPSTVNIGVLKYQDRLYAFSHIKYARIFAKNVRKFENKFMETVRRNAQLIIYLGLYNDIKEYNFLPDMEKMEQLISQEVPQKSVEIQTELHPIPFYIKKNYTFSLWEIRRRCLQMHRLTKCVTHSVQTDSTYYKRSANLQTNFQKDDKMVQTKTSTSTSTKRCN